jgi:hypothetical protein
MRTAVGVAQARELQLVGRHGPAAKPRLGTRQSESRLSELSSALFILSPNTSSIRWSWPDLYLLSQKLLPEGESSLQEGSSFQRTTLPSSTNGCHTFIPVSRFSLLIPHTPRFLSLMCLYFSSQSFLKCPLGLPPHTQTPAATNFTRDTKSTSATQMLVSTHWCPTCYVYCLGLSRRTPNVAL